MLPSHFTVIKTLYLSGFSEVQSVKGEGTNFAFNKTFISVFHFSRRGQVLFQKRLTPIYERKKRFTYDQTNK